MYLFSKAYYEDAACASAYAERRRAGELPHYEDCAFDYVNQFDTPACDMEPGNDDRRFAEDFLNETEWEYRS